MDVQEAGSGRLERLTQDLTASRGRLFEAISGVTEEQFKRRPNAVADGGEPWSIAEVLAHLLACERLAGERIALALDRDGSPIAPLSPEAKKEAVLAGRRSPIPQIVHGLLASRREVERQAHRAAGVEGGLERRVAHALLGLQSVEWLLTTKVIAHETRHTEQIERLRAEFGIAPVERESR